MLEKSPHIYIIGNQPEFATDVVTSATGDEKTRLILLPRFSQAGCIALVNTRTLEVRSMSFQVAGM